MNHYLVMKSEAQGEKEFGPYLTLDAAALAAARMQQQAASLNDGITRWFSFKVKK